MKISQVRTKVDLDYIQNALAILNISYATPAQAVYDYKSKVNRLYALKDNGRLIAICSVVPEMAYNYKAIKRLVVLNPADRGKGYAKKLVAAVVGKQIGTVGCTPWQDNTPMQNMLASLGFEYQYNFNNFWTFWKIDLDK